MKHLSKKYVMSLPAALGLAVLLNAPAFAVNDFGFDTADILTDLTTVGTLMVGVGTLILGYKLVRRFIAR